MLQKKEYQCKRNRYNMPNTKTLLKKFIAVQLSEMAGNITANFTKIMEARKENPFLIIDEKINKCMGLGRSTDSQLGNRMQSIVFYAARLKYGDNVVPNVVSITLDENTNKVICTCYYIPLSKYDITFHKVNGRIKQQAYKQIVFVNKDITIQTVSKKLAVVDNAQKNIKRYEISFEVKEKEKFEYLKKYQKKEKIEIDLLLFKSIIETFEIKLGGGLDTKNAPANIKEISELKELFAFSNSNHTYFATCYGNGSEAVSKSFDNSQKPFDQNDKILKNTMFWDLVLPKEVPYEEFINLYKTSFKKAGINKALKLLIGIK